MAENVKSMDRDAELRQEFGEMVRVCERCADEATKPWKIATGTLSLLFVAALLHKQKWPFLARKKGGNT